MIMTTGSIKKNMITSDIYITWAVKTIISAATKKISGTCGSRCCD